MRFTRLTAAVFAAVFALSAAACGGDTPSGGGGDGGDAVPASPRHKGVRNG